MSDGEDGKKSVSLNDIMAKLGELDGIKLDLQSSNQKLETINTNVSNLTAKHNGS